MITPSLNLTATERVLPRLFLDFTTALLDSRVTFTRATSASNPATYVASDGYITTATNDQPRFDYNPITKVCRGLLIEEARSNLLTYSEELNRLTRTRSNNTADQVLSPANTLTADNFYDDTTVSNTHFAVTASISFTSGAYYTFSIFVKKNGRNISLAFSSASFGANVRYTFDLDAGTSSVNVAGTNSSASIINVGNGYWRCSITSQATATASSTAALYLIDGSTLSYTGDGASGVYIWGAQLEAGAFATSYIPTTSTSLTRNADAVSMTGTNFSDWYNASEGAFSCSFDFAVDTARFPMSVSDGTNNNRMQLMCWSSRQGQIVSGGSDQALFDNGTVTVGAVTTVAMAYKANSAALSLNGAVASTDATVSVPTVDRLYFGNATSGGDVINGHVRELLYWPQRITNNEVRAFAV